MRKNFIGLIPGFLVLTVTTIPAQTPFLRFAELFAEFNTTLEELAKSSVLQSSDAYFVNDLFLSIVRQNQAIEAVARISSDGSVMNRVTPQGTSNGAKSVANERWFTAIAANREPRNDLLADPSGGPTLFRAWPLVDETYGSSRFTGAFTVRINVRNLLSGFADAENLAMEALFRGEPIMQSGWRPGDRFEEESITLSSGDQITLRFQTPPPSPDPGVSRVALQVETEPDAPAKRSIPKAATAAKAAKTTMKQEPASVRQRSSFDAPSLHATVLSDSFLVGSDLPSLGSGRMILIVIVSILTLCAIIVSLVIAVRMMLHRHDVGIVSRVLRPGPIEAIVVPATGLAVPYRDTREVVSGTDHDPLLDVSSPERETRELPALKELIAESSHRLKELDLTADAEQRSTVLREIHENLSQWVRGELGRLSSHLGSLAQEIRECETADGHTAELQVLRYEIERIMDEISGLDQKIPNEIFSR